MIEADTALVRMMNLNIEYSNELLTRFSEISQNKIKIFICKVNCAALTIVIFFQQLAGRHILKDCLSYVLTADKPTDSNKVFILKKNHTYQGINVKLKIFRQPGNLF